MKAWRLYLRSVPGQLLLFAGLFTGAAIAACVPMFFRERFFEGTVREVYAPLEGYALQAAEILARRTTDQNDREKVYDELIKRDKKVADPRSRWKHMEAIYGGWIQEAIDGDHNLLARRLVEFQPDWVLERVKRTLAAGTLSQRERAVEFLTAIAGESEVREDVRKLAEVAERRARRRGETELMDKARAVLHPKGAKDGQ